MPRSIAIPAVCACALALACGGTSPGAAAPGSAEPDPGEPAVGASEPSGPAPPRYKPSSSSKAPMPITDPAYGAFRLAPEAPGLGARLPDFEVALADGGTFALKEARGAGPVLIMFYRGFW